MDVTRANFAEVLPQALEAIRDADFIAIDLELTGTHLLLDPARVAD